VRAIVDWAVDRAEGPVYIRLVSVRWALPFDPPEAGRVVPGQGTVLRTGKDGLFVGAGPVMIGGAWHAADLLADEGLEFGVVSLPWLRDIDGEWLAEAAPGSIVCLDNHLVVGGQGDAILGALAAQAPHAAARVVKVGVDRVPACGANEEVLRAHGLDAESLTGRVLALATPAFR
jgi:transketolase